MTRQEEAAFKAKTARWEKEHHDVPLGRNFLAFTERFHGGDVQRNYDIGQCRTFPNAPGNRMCGACHWSGDCEVEKEIA